MMTFRHRITGETVTLPFRPRQLKAFVEVAAEPGVSPMPQAGTRSEMLIIRRALGDVLLLFPALEMWCETQGTTVDFGTDVWLMELARRQPFIHSAYPFDSDLSRWSRIVPLERTVDFVPIRMRKHRTLLFADLLWAYSGGTYDASEIRVGDYFQVTAEETTEAIRLLRAHGFKNHRPLVAIAPISKSRFRNWGKEESLIKRCPDLDFVMFHSEPLAVQTEYPNLINLSGQTTIMQMAAVASVCNAAVVPDSGLMHVCGVLGVPTLAIFGKVIPARNRVAYYPSVRAIESSCPITEYCYDSQFATCDHTLAYRACMSEITADMVKTQLMEMLS